jgi:F-type H+-transporting ATPase subunit b
VQIDWFTLIAQGINFLVLVWLLKRFLYGRIARAMDEREARIASRLEEAARKQAEAEQEVDRYRVKSQELEEQREKVLAQTREEAEARRLQLVQEARTVVAQLQAQWFETLQREKEELLREFRERTGQQVLAIARRALKDLAGAELDQQMLVVFLEQVRKLEPAERQAMVEAIRHSDREVELRSAFPVAPDIRERVTQDLREQLDDGVVVRFEVEPQLGCGIELRAHSHRMVWNLASYLDALEDTFFQGLEERARDNGKPDQDERVAACARAIESGPR